MYNSEFNRSKNNKLVKVIDLFYGNLLTQTQKIGFYLIDVHKLTVNDHGFSNLRYHIGKHDLSPSIIQSWNVDNFLAKIFSG